MAQEFLPKVWTEVQQRIDTCNIVREVLGHFALESIGQTSRASSFNFIVWVKVIFDLQRTYLQSSKPSDETLSYLLPPQILLKLIQHVLEKRNGLRHIDANNYRARRYFAAQTLLSGVRALQLRGMEDLLAELEWIDPIKPMVREWLKEIKEGPEEFILNKCYRGLNQMRRGPNPGSVWNKPACDVCELRDDAADLYPALTKRMLKDLTSQLSQAEINTDLQDAFWARFDIMWAVEAGYIQWRADILGNKDVSNEDCQAGSLIQVFEEITPERYAMFVLKHTWHNRRHGWDHSESRDDDPVSPEIDEALSSFYDFLRHRRGKLLGSNSEIKNLSTDLDQNIEAWIRTASSYGEYEDIRAGAEPLSTGYILSCPMLHVVPEHQLRSLIGEESDHIFRNPGLLDIPDYPIYCPRCPQRQLKTVIRHARRIDPLNSMSNQLKHLVEASIPPQESNAREQLILWRQNKAHWPSYKDHKLEIVPARTSNDIPPHVLRTPSSSNPQPSSPSSSVFPSPIRISSDVDDSASTKTTNTSARLKVGALFKNRRKSSTISKESALEATTKRDVLKSYCFSSDGKMLILWNSRSTHVYCSVIPTTDGPESVMMWEWFKFETKSAYVDLVAGGEQRVAVISKENKLYRLLIFSMSAPPNSEPMLERSLPRDKKLITRSISMSSDGKIVAVGADKEVLVYDVDKCINDTSLEPRVIKLSGMDVASQCLSFNEENLVIATRCWSGVNCVNCVNELVLYDLPTSQEVQRFKTKPTPFIATDVGLSAVFYDHTRREFILTGCINKGYGNVYSRRGNSAIYWPPESSKIQAAVACPSQSQYLLLGSSGGVYSVDLSDERSRKRPSKFEWEYKVSPPEYASQFVALAASKDDRIYFFRIEKEEMILEVIQGKNSPARRKEILGPLISDL
ncbi:hypothetical protein HYFRA_00012198 [Hymenoscyphus fraxineus]|uniref:WD40 repeat-like protein n=1 Tax=Hymenoscyphus fraxineus TaxID=746836 RepID=A0A9N9L8S1_9HELO|nr:hypothetical protein HYFRA_00012198 [Hymenoscyphus fraxineus]